MMREIYCVSCSENYGDNMSNFGLKIINQNGPDTMLDSSCTMCCILGICDSYPKKTGIYVPYGYEYYVHYTNGCDFNFKYIEDADTGPGTGLSGVCDAASYLDENRQVILTKGEHSCGESDYYDTLCIVIGYPLHSPVNGMGISFTGGNNFFSINDASLCAPVVFKGEVTLLPDNNGWSPESINPLLNFKNSVVFVYCDNPNISIGIFRLRRYDQNRGIYAFDANGNAYKNKVKIKVVVFSKQPIKKSQYGLQIFNNNGNPVYDSSSGVLINPQMYSFGRIRMRQFVAIPDIKRPMFIPTSIGGSVDLDHYSGDVKLVGLSSNGFCLAPSFTCLNYLKWTVRSKAFFISGRPIMVLDAENYFKF